MTHELAAVAWHGPRRIPGALRLPVDVGPVRSPRNGAAGLGESPRPHVSETLASGFLGESDAAVIRGVRTSPRYPL